MFFPGIKFLIGSGILPSLFITFPFLQFTAVIVSFGFSWPDSGSIKNVFRGFGAVNFDMNLLFLDCWLRPSFLGKFVFFQSLPVLYAIRYFGPHYLSRFRGECQDDSDLELSGWTVALRETLFIVNLLYVGLAQSVLSVYVCTEITPGLSVMTFSPTVPCYEAEHVASMIFSTVPIFIYIILWPNCICLIFYAGKKRLLLNNCVFAQTFGFLYKRCHSCKTCKILNLWVSIYRYEVQWYYWHGFIAGYKLLFVICKVFLFQNFWQGPAAMAAVLSMLLMQAFARPFESSRLDRLMTLVQATLGIEIFFG